MDDKLIIDASRVDPEGEEIEGEVECIDLDEEFVKPFGGVRYRLNLQVFGTELLVRGHLEQDFDLVCCRCGKDYDDTIKVDDFTISYEISDKSPEVDLTEDVRESIILHLPTYPVCRSDCRGICAQCGKNLNEGPCACSAERHDSRWDVLDDLTKGE